MSSALIGGTLFCLACSSSPPPSQPPPQSASQSPGATAAPTVQRYDLKGTVISVDKSGKKLTVDHEAIPGFMGAMTMAYSVKDDTQLDRVSKGEKIKAKVVWTGSDFWLEEIAPAVTAPATK